jgi:hypothetical protein
MSWNFPSHRVTLDFASPRKPRLEEFAEGSAILRAATLSVRTEVSGSAE